MKRIIVLRHSKSSWDHWGVSDVDRPLNQKGFERSVKVGKFLHQNHIEIDCMISSTAVRSVTTALVLGRQLKFDFSNLQIREELYHGDIDEIVDVIRNIDDTVNNAMIIAHNPGIEDFANVFIENVEIITTSGIMLDLNIENWKSFSKSDRSILNKEIINPKKISLKDN
jgi:phosphohistidine phosphatase